PNLPQEHPVRAHLSVYDGQVVRRHGSQDAKKVANLLVWRWYEATAQLAAPEWIAENRTVACIGHGQVVEDVTHVGDYRAAGQEDVEPGMWKEPRTALPEGIHHRRQTVLPVEIGQLLDHHASIRAQSIQERRVVRLLRRRAVSRSLQYEHPPTARHGHDLPLQVAETLVQHHHILVRDILLDVRVEELQDAGLRWRRDEPDVRLDNQPKLSKAA